MLSLLYLMEVCLLKCVIYHILAFLPYFQKAACLLLEQRKQRSKGKDMNITDEAAKEQFNNENNNQTRVAVFSCGSEPFLDEVRMVQQRFNRNTSSTDIRFDLHEEMFMF